jgi:hypothetical protein
MTTMQRTSVSVDTCALAELLKIHLEGTDEHSDRGRRIVDELGEAVGMTIIWRLVSELHGEPVWTLGGDAQWQWSLLRS